MSGKRFGEDDDFLPGNSSDPGSGRDISEKANLEKANLEKANLEKANLPQGNESDALVENKGEENKAENKPKSGFNFFDIPHIGASQVSNSSYENQNLMDEQIRLVLEDIQNKNFNENAIERSKNSLFSEDLINLLAEESANNSLANNVDNVQQGEGDAASANIGWQPKGYKQVAVNQKQEQENASYLEEQIINIFEEKPADKAIKGELTGLTEGNNFSNISEQEYQPRRDNSKVLAKFRRFTGWFSSSRTNSNIILFMTVFLVLVGGSILVIRLANLMLIGREEDASKNIVIKQKKQVIGRGSIYDRNGIVIATNLGGFDVQVNASEVGDHDNFIAQIQQVFRSIPEERIRRKLKENNWFALFTSITPEQASNLLELGVRGIYLSDNIKRAYVQGDVISEVVGYVDSDNKGIAGIEYSFNNQLEQGKEVILSIDIRMQNYIKEILSKKVAEYNARGAGAVVVEIATGEVLALVSLPAFNPYTQRYITLEDKRYNNKISYDLYEWGSIFKIITVAKALESGVKPTDLFDISKGYQVGNYKIHDSYRYKNILSTKEAFYYSSNVGMLMMTNKIPREERVDFYSRLGLFSPLGLELVEKSSPIYSKKWNKYQLESSSYGYGFSMTMLHIVRAVMSLLNENSDLEYGEVRDLTLLKNNRLKVETGYQGKEQIISPQTREDLLEMMSLVITDGSGRKARGSNYPLAGKTGSARKSKAGIYSDKDIVVSFVGLVPSKEPKYVIATMLDEPKADNYRLVTAGNLIAEVARDINDFVASTMDVEYIPAGDKKAKAPPKEVKGAPSKEDSVKTPPKSEVLATEKPVIDKTPDEIILKQDNPVEVINNVQQVTGESNRDDLTEDITVSNSNPFIGEKTQEENRVSPENKNLPRRKQGINNIISDLP